MLRKILIIFVLFFLFAGCKSPDLVKNKNVYFISYGNEKFKESRERIKKEAEQTNWFKNVKIYTPENIGAEFLNKHKDFLAKNSRGGGYWIWKPYIIKKQLDIINNGDFIVYLDSGSTVNAQGKDRLNDYLHALDGHKSGVLGFRMDLLLEKCWTKADLLSHMGVLENKKITDSGQVMATGLIIQKNKNSQKLINNWYELISEQNYHLVDDSVSKINNSDCFEEHRHDQSIFSILIKKAQGVLFGDEIQNYSKSYPFRATRKRQ